MTLNLTEAKTRADYAAVVYLRVMVFMVEQGCTYPEEIDAFEDDATHFIAYDGLGLPAATVRIRLVDDGKTGKIERVAVASHQRGKGYGRELVQAMTDRLAAMPDIGKIVLSAQDQAMPLYEKLGYSVTGDGYLDAGIPHHMMEKRL